MHEFLVSALAFIVLIGIMVVVHEFGHFAVAKLCGVRVESFSVGFGPRLFGIKYGDTDYKVCLLPLGGYVKFHGDVNGASMTDNGEIAAMPAGERAILTAHARPCFLRRFEIQAAAHSLIQILTPVIEGRALPQGREECVIATS